jgi:integrase
MSKETWSNVAPGVSIASHPSGGATRWRIRVWAGYGRDGRPVRAHRSFTGTKRQATGYGIDLRRELTEAPPDPSKHTVGSWFAEYLRHKRAQADRDDLSPTTVDGYTSTFRRYVAEHRIARLPLAALEPPNASAHLVAWASDLTERHAPGRERLSAKTIHHALSTMRSALRYGNETGVLSRDPFRTFPRHQWPRLHRGRPSKRSVGSAGLAAVRAAFVGHEIEAEVALMTLGLRRGEILGLRIRGGDEAPEEGDLSLGDSHRRIRVRQVLVDADGGARVRPFPKSDASVRDLHLPAWTVPPLRAAKRRALEVYMRAGRSDEPDLLLFPSKGRHQNGEGRAVGTGRAGDPQHPNALNRKFRARLAEVGLEGVDPARVSPHALRHSFVSYLVTKRGCRSRRSNTWQVTLRSPRPSLIEHVTRGQPHKRRRPLRNSSVEARSR